MSNKRYYSPEFKRETLEMLAIGDHTIAGLERTLGITPGLVRQWKRKAQRNGEYVSPNGEPKTDKEAAARICELEKGNAWLRQEREILKKRWPSLRPCSAGKSWRLFHHSILPVQALCRQQDGGAVVNDVEALNAMLPPADPPVPVQGARSGRCGRAGVESARWFGSSAADTPTSAIVPSHGGGSRV